MADTHTYLKVKYGEQINAYVPTKETFDSKVSDLSTALENVNNDVSQIKDTFASKEVYSKEEVDTLNSNTKTYVEEYVQTYVDESILGGDW